jgi:hypothetical protein
MTRLLVIANETAASELLCAAVRRQSPDEVLVVAPALTTRLALWSSDTTRARGDAAQRVRACLACLASVGIRAEGFVGDADPLLAIADALAIFRADAILISTHPEPRSNWLARRIVERARERFDVPVGHVATEAQRAVA